MANSKKMKYKKLDTSIRQIMDEEFKQDKQRNRLYSSPRLNDVGNKVYPDLLEKALLNGSDRSFANDLRDYNTLKNTEKMVNPFGGIRESKIPSDAPDNLAKGEFQRYYIRALCRKAIDQGIKRLQIISEKPIDALPDEVKVKIGRTVNPKDILEDLRENDYTRTRFGILEPASDLSLDTKKF